MDHYSLLALKQIFNPFLIVPGAIVGFFIRSFCTNQFGHRKTTGLGQILVLTLLFIGLAFILWIVGLLIVNLLLGLFSVQTHMVTNISFAIWSLVGLIIKGRLVEMDNPHTRPNLPPQL
ncbi:MAG: hypothetical protein HQL53_01040 [Magnetococcales bacterium]|nr:hypothetical protein [Magnetococcales bacterium]